MRIHLSSVRRAVALGLPLAILSIACSSGPGDPAGQGSTAPDPATAAPGPAPADLQPSVDALTRALAERNSAAFDALLSSEVRAQMQARGYDVDAFLAKQRGALERSLGLAEGARAPLTVFEARREGDAVRVTLRSGGTDLAKPLFFVMEDGVYKINFGAPGFSKAPPDGALFGKDNYTVHNVNIYGNGPTTLECYQGSGRYMSFTVAATKTVKVACENTCGWFSGSTFAGNGAVRKCDWNWWGDDVVINLLDYGGFHCNDPC